ncbi:MAG: endonuclease III, partial [Firmicutes bacterium]|nr:endonuclease III [Bacillota bacterium]
QVEQDLLSSFPPGTRQAAHHLLIRHGREVCTARKPRCMECVIAVYCPGQGVGGAVAEKPDADREGGVHDG